MALQKNPKFDLKEKYSRVLAISMICSLSFVLLAFKIFPEVDTADKIKPDSPEPPIDVYIPPVKEPPEPPPPPKPYTIIENPADELLDDINYESSELNPDAEMKKADPPFLEKNTEEEYFPFFRAEDKPAPVGGVAGIMSRIDYPEIARRAGITGRVVVEAYVDENGDVQKVVLLKGIGGGCDEEAINAVFNTKFIPGKQRGVPVKVRVTIPVMFRLK